MVNPFSIRTTPGLVVAVYSSTDCGAASCETNFAGSVVVPALIVTCVVLLLTVVFNRLRLQYEDTLSDHLDGGLNPGSKHQRSRRTPGDNTDGHQRDAINDSIGTTHTHIFDAIPYIDHTSIAILDHSAIDKQRHYADGYFYHIHTGPYGFPKYRTGDYDHFARRTGDYDYFDRSATTTNAGHFTSDDDHNRNTWLIVGVSVGVLLLVIVIIIIIVIVVCVYRRKKKVVKEPLIKPEPARIPTYITNPRVQKKPKPPPHGYRATGPNAPYHYEAKDFHWRGPAKFDTRPIGIEDLPEPSSNETALSYHSDEHVEFDKDLNEVYEIGSEVEEYLDRPNPRNKLKKSKSKESSGRHDPNKAVIER
ncbi:hypothetical protein AAVH_05685 [Aphelenchoides avenae]|nr:hypothetical protein AAVH_05685 [Aphelenchus avenae]